MAHGYLEHYGKGAWEVFSAGIETHGVNPIAIGVLAEDGINILKNTSNNENEYRGIDFDVVLTVCDNAKEQCPYFPSSAKLIHHSFKDPAYVSGSAKEVISSFRDVRDEIKTYCEHLLTTI